MFVVFVVGEHGEDAREDLLLRQFFGIEGAGRVPVFFLHRQRDFRIDAHRISGQLKIFGEFDVINRIELAYRIHIIFLTLHLKYFVPMCRAGLPH